MAGWRERLDAAAEALTFRRVFEAAILLIPFTQTFTIKAGIRVVPSEALLCLCLLMILFGAGGLAMRRVSIQLSLVFGLCVLCGVVLGVYNYGLISAAIPAVAMAEIKDYAYWILLDAFKGMAVVSLIVGMDLYLRGPADFIRLSRLVFMSAMFVAAYGIYVFFAKRYGLPLLPGTYIGNTNRSASTFWEPNTFGNYITLALAFYYVYAYTVAKKPVSLVVFALFVGSGLASVSTVFLSLFLPIALANAAIHRDGRGFVVGIVVALLAIGYVVSDPDVFVSVVQERLMAKLGLSPGGYVHVSTRERMEALNGALEMVRNQYWLGGVGIGSGYALFGKVSNMAVELWLDCSVIGLAAFALLVCSPFYSPGRTYLLPQRALMAGLLILVSQSLGFKFILYYYFFALWSFHLPVLATARVGGDASNADSACVPAPIAAPAGGWQ